MMTKPPYESSPTSCTDLDYLEIPPPVNTCSIRYNQESTATLPLTNQAAQPSPVINFDSPGQPSVFNSTPAYSTDPGGTFYQHPTHLFPSPLDHLRRTAASNASASGMAHGPRSAAALPPPISHISQTRDYYSPSTPGGYKTNHIPRSPPFPVLTNRSAPRSVIGFPGGSTIMDPNFGNKSLASIPPLESLVLLGTLRYSDSPPTNPPLKIDINGVIDKGFFLAEGEWTCYRRNYFTCICSFSINPWFPNNPMTYTPNSGPQTSYQVYGFAMCISAVVADSESHEIDLHQHTPKRDKGPIAKPEKVRLTPKPPPSQHHMSMFNQGDPRLSEPGRYEPFGQSQGAYANEHTFERIQFKQATANNGKRRAAQQYYHLVVELYADVGAQGQVQSGGDQFIKIAYRKSAKMIVRGRSPGHYQAERRGSTSSGPGGSAGNIGYQGPVLGHEYGAGSQMLSGGYGGGYDPRSTSYPTNMRQHSDMSMEPIDICDDDKSLEGTKDYQYFPAPFLGSTSDPSHRIELFSPHRRSVHDDSGSHMSNGLDGSSHKVKHEYNSVLPSLSYTTPSSLYTTRCGQFDGKPTSSGYYPTMMTAPPSGMNMT